jgi:signal transduction histidine kinase
VADSGAGIPPELLPRIFEPYVTTKAGGTGLGLAIAERIMQEHGGRLEVVSPPGGGATFTARLPVAG